MTARKTTPKKAPATKPSDTSTPPDGSTSAQEGNTAPSGSSPTGSTDDGLAERAAAEAQDLGRKADEEDAGPQADDPTDEVLEEMRESAVPPVKQWWAELPDGAKNTLRRGLPEKGYVAVGNAMDHGELSLDGQKLAEVWPLVTGRPVPDLHDALREMLRAGVGSHTYGALRQLGEDLFGAEWSQGL